MGKKVEVVVDGRTFEIDEATQKRWPADYPLAVTKAGKPTAAAKRAKPAPTPAEPAAHTTKTADDLKAAGASPAGNGTDTTKEA